MITLAILTDMLAQFGGMGMRGGGSYFLLVLLPGMVLSGAATWMVKSTFAKYSKVAATSGITGAEAAQRLLDNAGITDVTIEATRGMLSDHYDPRAKALRLSEPVFASNSLSAIGVACHEAGHAIQHATGYKWLGMRSKMVPATGLTSKMAMPVLGIGMMLSYGSSVFGDTIGNLLMFIGVALFSVAVLFSVITLPVEWDASARAKKLMVSAGIVSNQESDTAGRVLNAAFLTYLASAIASLLTLLYYVNRIRR